MDFDDLDDVVDQRMADGDMEGLDQFAAPERKELKPFPEDKTLPPMPTHPALWATPIEDPQFRMRAFVFYGPGDVAKDYEELLTRVFQNDNRAVEVAVYEWPGHGSRAGEPPAADISALATDAFEAMRPALDQVKEDAEYEGARFAFIGRSVGCQLMVLLQKKILMAYRMSPCVAVVMDRAAPHIPMLSDIGQAVLQNDPEKVLKALNFRDAKFSGMDKDLFAKDMQYGCEVHDQFYHKLDCTLVMIKGHADAELFQARKANSNFRVTSIQIKGTRTFFQMPVEKATTVDEVTKCVASIFAYSKKTVVKSSATDGSSLDAYSVVGDNIVVEGIEDFKHPRFTWPHPVCIIGAGFQGIKMAMQYHINKNYNVVMYDRLKEAGGYAWHLSATKHSRVQTDFGAFNIWWGHHHNFTGDTGFGAKSPDMKGRLQFMSAFAGPGSPGPVGCKPDGTVESGAGTGVDFNPLRHQVLKAMQHALREYNAEEICTFETEVNSLQIIGDKDWEGRCYKLGLKSLKDKPFVAADLAAKKLVQDHTPDSSTKVSVIYHFPGAYDINRIVDYPGESEFGGHIGYGMGNGHGGLFIFDSPEMCGGRAAILGNGAFSVENIRSCAENGASKIYLVTRRKSLLCPRLPCWFCHQGPAPTGAHLLLDFFKPMYDCGGLQDPWDHYAVLTNEKRSFAKVTQSSRFGIGDVTFLCAAMGMLEYRVDTLQRCSFKTMHLTGGEKLENMTHICKALGLIGDPKVDQLHGITHKIGSWVNGDWRRIITADATGMDAMRFTTFSAGPGACAGAKDNYYIHNHPWEIRWGKCDELWPDIPKHTISSTQPDQPCYMTNIGYEMHAGNMLGNVFRERGRCHGDESVYKYALIHTMHPTPKYIEYCKADWDRYQKMFRGHNPGFADAPEVPYPYNMDMVKSWFQRYSEEYKFEITVDGPPESDKVKCIEDFRKNDEYLKQEMIPYLIRESNLLPSCPPAENHSRHDNPTNEAMASTMYELKKDITRSSPDSALDFDDAQLNAWKEIQCDGYGFHVIDTGLYSAETMKQDETWGHISGMLAQG